MKDLSYPIRKAYYQAISSLGYGCYDSKAPNDAILPFVILGVQNNVDESTKTSFNNRCTINLDLYASNTEQYSARKVLDNMVNTIMSSIMPAPYATSLSIQGFNIFGTKKVIDNDFDPIVTDEQTILRKIIVIEHLIQENNG